MAGHQAPTLPKAAQRSHRGDAVPFRPRHGSGAEEKGQRRAARRTYADPRLRGAGAIFHGDADAPRSLAISSLLRLHILLGLARLRRRFVFLVHRVARRTAAVAFVDKALGRGRDRRRDRSHEHQGSEAAD
jgi:hypothetical protein